MDVAAGVVLGVRVTVRVHEFFELRRTVGVRGDAADFCVLGEASFAEEKSGGWC